MLYINDEWLFFHTNSDTYPGFDELIQDIVTTPEWYGDKENKITKVFTLVLNCDEICAADQYCDYICFFAKYETENNIIEICDQRKALLEFQELLQKSTDFPRKW